MLLLQLGPFPPPEGGVSRNMLAIRDAVRERGDRCSIIAISRSTSVRDEPDVYHPTSGFDVIRRMAAFRFDVLHMHVGGDVSRRILLLAMAATFFGRGKCVLTLHSGAFPLTKEARSAKPGSIRGIIFRRFTRIICVNDQLADVFRRYGVAEDRIKIILPFSLKKTDENVAVPERLTDFFNKHSPVLLAVGGLEKDYDPLFQIAAMEGILREYPNAGLMIVGDGSMRDEVEKPIAATAYAENICIAGNIEHAVTLHLIEDADILLRTTLFDGDAISVREAQFLGTPVIATDNGMRPAGVSLIPIGDTDALVTAVRDLVSNGKTEGSETSRDNDNIDAVLNLYSEICYGDQRN